MHLLLCNDDGFQAPGIQTLARALREAGHRVTISAPSEERSGQSHAMTFFHPVLVKYTGDGVYAVHGSPADGAVIGLLDILKDDPPDFVISGINDGLNVGIDVHYSGTIGAATEASLLGFKAVAVSVDTQLPSQTRKDKMSAFEECSLFVTRLVEKLPEIEWPRHFVLNVSHPGIPARSTVATDSATSSLFHPAVEKLTPLSDRSSNTSVYLIGGNVRNGFDESSTEAFQIQKGNATLTFLQARQGCIAATQSLVNIAQGLSAPDTKKSK